MTINGSTNHSLWTYKLEANEIAYNIAERKSTIKIDTYLGRKNSNSYIGGNYSNSVSINDGNTQTKNGNIKYPTYINAGQWLLLQTFTFEVQNEGTNNNPTTIKISSSLNSSDFNPSNASAEGYLTLTVLHTDPIINGIELTELNENLINLGIEDNTIVQYLSQKKILVNANTYNDAVITKYDIYHNNILIGTSTNNILNIDFNNVNELVDSGTKNIGLIINVNDNLGGKASRSFSFPIIKYTRPTIESTSTNIRRKTGNGVVLTDNKATLNFVGNCYNETDVIGNNNNPIVKYKIWESGTEEPDYINLTVKDITNVIIKDYELSNLDYTKTYNYKIKIYDNFTTSETTTNLKVDKLPTGISVWSEYKDRVDFDKVTIKNKEVFPNVFTTEEKVIGIWEDGKPLYSQTIYLQNIGVEQNLPIKNIDTIFIDVSNSYITWDWNEFSYPIDRAKFQIYKGHPSIRAVGEGVEDWMAVVTIKYTKTTD